MITPQIIQSEPEHPHLLVEMANAQENMRNHLSYPNFNHHHQLPPPPMKYKSEPEYQPSASISESSSSSPNKKPKKEVDSSKAYKCPQCVYSFNRRDHLTRHSLVHSKLKPCRFKRCFSCSNVNFIGFCRPLHLLFERLHAKRSSPSPSTTSSWGRDGGSSFDG